MTWVCASMSLRRFAKRADPAVLEYMSGMQPHLVVAGCRFSHVEPWLDGWKVEDLWHFEGPPDTPDKAARSFAAVPERHLFIGHFHKWLVMTPSGPIKMEWRDALRVKRGVKIPDNRREPFRRDLRVAKSDANGRCAME